MAKSFEKGEAIKMRKRGASIREIARNLDVSKSTVSRWCEDVELSQKQIKQLEQNQRKATHASILKLAENNRKKKTHDIENATRMGKDDIAKMNKRDLLIAGLALYWGEGYKKGSQEFGFSNSDPSMIAFIICWLEKIYEVPRKDLILRVSINEAHEQRIKEVMDYWVSVTGIPETQFTKPSFVHAKHKKQYENFFDHYGTLRVKVRRSTNLRRRILASIEALGSCAALY